MKTFVTFAEALGYCSLLDAPINIVIIEPCSTCCRELTNEMNTGERHKRAHRLYPSGRIVPLTYIIAVQK
jgi:hypothetical protein